MPEKPESASSTIALSKHESEIKVNNLITLCDERFSSRIHVLSNRDSAVTQL